MNNSDTYAVVTSTKGLTKIFLIADSKKKMAHIIGKDDNGKMIFREPQINDFVEGAGLIEFIGGENECETFIRNGRREYLDIKDKQTYLNRHYPFENVPKLTDKKYCLHCEKDFEVKDYKVEKSFNFTTERMEEYIVCPNAPECDGTVIDWMPAMKTKNQ